MDTLNAEIVLKDSNVRLFLREFILESSGVDIADRIPSGRVFNEYEQGKYKIAIDLVNFMLYNCPKSYADMRNEFNKDRRNS